MNTPYNLIIYIPNFLTLLRLALVPVLIVLLQEQQFQWSLMVFLSAGITDGLDGYIAKRFNAQTKLGALLDPLADKALLVSAFVMLSILELIPFWLMVVVVFRDLIIIGGYLLMVTFFGEVAMRPLKVSKVNTFLQISFIVVVLAGLAWQFEIVSLVQWFSYVILVTGVASGGAYVYIWSIKAMQSGEEIDSAK